MTLRSVRFPLLATLVAFFLSLVAVSGARAADVDDGVLPQGVLPYVARAQVQDYTTLGAPGQIATITVRRAAFVFSRNIVANRNETVGVRTNVPGRVYAFTCSYRGQQVTKYVQATRSGGYVRFNYTSDGRLR